jgi:hypothetical protein
VAAPSPATRPAPSPSRPSRSCSCSPCAAALTGPWSDAATLFEADQKSTGNTTYDAYVQPDYAEVTCSCSTGELSSELVLTRVTFNERGSLARGVRFR